MTAFLKRGPGERKDLDCRTCEFCEGVTLSAYKFISSKEAWEVQHLVIPRRSEDILVVVNIKVPGLGKALINSVRDRD